MALPNMAATVPARRDLGREMVGREKPRKSIMNGNGHAASVGMQQWTQRRRRLAQNVVMYVVRTVRWRRSRDIGHDVRQMVYLPYSLLQFSVYSIGP